MIMERQVEAIRAELQSKVGVQPSNHWLYDCLEALHQQNIPENKLGDECLYQILHHDLRDVVRTFDPSPHDPAGDQPPVRLRTALKQSMAPPFKAEITAPFRLLLQIEELLDVGQTATSRLEGGPASQNHGNHGNNNQSANRCLKLFLSDGYNPQTGLSFYNGDNDQNQDNNAMSDTTTKTPMLIAMEATSIPQLSTNSRAGLKIVLAGKIMVRHGVLLLNAGNTTVVGGVVPALAELQAQALEQAKRLAGVGVDPTIRALIGNPNENTGEEDNNQDEGEAPSADVAPAPVPLATATTTTTIPPPRTAPAPAPTSIRRPNEIQSERENQRASSSLPQSGPVEMEIDSFDESVSQSTLASEGPRVPSRPSSTNNNMYSSSGVNPYLSGQRSQTNSSPPPTAAASNPYSRRTTTDNGSTTNSQTCTLEDMQITTTDPAINHQAAPLLKNPPSSNPYSASRTTTTGEIAAENVAGSTTGPNGLSRGDISRTNATTTAIAANAAHRPTNPDINTTTAKRMTLSFGELRMLMGRIRSNPDIHKRYIGHTFISAIRQVGARVDFNIAKVKKSAGSGGSQKKEKQYEYLLICKFGGEDESNRDDLLTCQVASALQEPYFGLSPKGMRDLSKRDRPQAQKRVKEGGEVMSLQLAKCATYELILYPEIPDELDGPKPMLILTKLHS